MGYVFIIIGALLALAVVVALVLGGLYLWRMRNIYRRVGAFPCTLRRENGSWVEGIGVFGAREISFFKQLSLGRRPDGQVRRDELEVVEHQSLRELAGDTLHARIQVRGVPYDIYLHTDAFAAVVSWVDAEGPSEEPTF